MKLYNYGKFPDERDYRYYAIEEFNNCELEQLNELNIQKAWYWYGEGDYEGTGYILMLKDNKYYVHDMGHCSCYGPLEDINFSRGYDSFDEIEANCSKEEYEQIKPLVEMAREVA